MEQSVVAQSSAVQAPRRLWHFIHAMQRATLVNYLILGLGAVLMLFPFAWMFFTSFKPRSEIMLYPPTLLPKEFTWQNYVNVFDTLDMAQLYWNTTYVTVVKTTLMIYTAALLGYVFGKFRFWGQETIFYGILFTMIIPFEVYVIPLYQMMVFAKLGDTFGAHLLISIDKSPTVALNLMILSSLFPGARPYERHQPANHYATPIYDSIPRSLPIFGHPEA